MIITFVMTDAVRAQDHAFTFYGGRVTKEKWLESISPGVNFTDAYILVAAVSRTLKSSLSGSFTMEIEGQVAKYYGDQDNFEFNIPIALRWHDFPWNGSVATSAAFGLGPSWANKEPRVETRINGSTRQLLAYWFAEISLGPPASNWAFIFRLHHRSKAFGLLAEEGGSNTLATGVRFSF